MSPVDHETEVELTDEQLKAVQQAGAARWLQPIPIGLVALLLGTGSGSALTSGVDLFGLQAQQRVVEQMVSKMDTFDGRMDSAELEHERLKSQIGKIDSLVEMASTMQQNQRVICDRLGAPCR